MINDLVSIVIPTFNRGDLIPRAIKSVLQQSYQNWELIIVDDGSTDGTKDLIDNYMRQDGRIKYLSNKRMKGPGGARNTGILHSTGKYIAFLDSDDEWFEYHLKDSLDALESNDSEVSLALWVEEAEGEIYNPFQRQETQDNIKAKRERFQANDNVIIFKNGLFEHFLEDDGWFYHINTAVIKKSVIEKYGLFNESYMIGEDAEYLVRLFDNVKILLIINNHFIYHQSPNSLYFFCNRNNINIESLLNDKQMIKKITDAGSYSNQFRFIIRERARNNTNIKNNEVLLKNLDSAISRKYFTLSYINSGQVMKSAYYCMKSLRYNFTKEKFLFLIKLFFPFVKVNESKYEFDFY
ncbi:glycosyltransferase family 2 protein [Paenibacillus alvei]|uniref:glycosyltransferase family 2 protein n=1 Tax=Paenibacillus alvei TaxID=44250 RepID=UPI000386BB4F|nr:glycosyltransferase family 2 protein [Paenibacillus alvei]EPY14036.1 glycosyltransferase [Paenibacillus alvei A6-6i-x]